MAHAGRPVNAGAPGWLVRLCIAATLAAAVAIVPPAGARSAQAAGPAGRYHPLTTPQRLVDTRLAQGASGPLRPEQVVTIPIAGALGMPSVGSGLTAVVLSVAVTDTSDIGYLTVWPSDQPLPNASNLNWMAGDTVANLVEVGVGTSGSVSFYNNHSSSQLIVDVQGYYASDPGPSGLFRPLMPARIADTRTGLGTGAVSRLGPASTLRIAVAGHGNVPATASAVAINLTETTASASSYLTVFPYLDGNAGVSNLNFSAGWTRAVRAIVRLDAQGAIGIYNSAGSVDVIVDVNGWFTDASDPGATGGRFLPVTPTRLLDTRNGTGRSGPLGSGEHFDFALTGGASPVPAGASAVAMNLTAVSPTAPNFVVAYPAGNARVLTSDVNSVPGGPVPNLALTRLSSSGAITLFNRAGQTHVLIDVVGYYEAGPAPGAAPGAPAGVSATAHDRSVTISWSPPASPGGSAIVSYLVSMAGGGDLPVAGDATSVTWTGLTNQSSYAFTVAALNGDASGPAAGPASATPIGTPDPPTGVAATPGPGTVTVSWSEPANNGGSPVTGYYVTVDQTGQRIGTLGSPVTIGLGPGTYTISISALNSYGAGPAANTGPVSPRGARKIVISLAQQHLWAYDAGQLRLETDVTTGRPELPTPPGDYFIFYKSSPYHMVSPWPYWSPYYYNPVDLQYAMEFLQGGYFLHDAYWRSWYGPGSDIYDGTHGCVNIPLSAMAWLYGWAQIGDEVVVQ